MAASTALAAVVIPLLVVPGATLLLERVQEHSQTYEEAREATSLIYERAAVAADAGATAAGPYATGACDFVRAVPASVTARCDAFAAVTTYNEILVKLAAGDPAVAVRSELGQLSVALGGLHAFLEQDTTVQTLLASAGPAVGPLLGIIDQAQKLTSAAALREELERGRPAVQAILQALREDVPRLYDLERSVHGRPTARVHVRDRRRSRRSRRHRRPACAADGTAGERRSERHRRPLRRAAR